MDTVKMTIDRTNVEKYSLRKLKKIKRYENNYIMTLWPIINA